MDLHSEVQVLLAVRLLITTAAFLVVIFILSNPISLCIEENFGILVGT